MSRLVLPVRYQNPHATMGLTLPLEVIENTPPEEIEYNTRTNSAKYSKWLQAEEPHALPVPAVLIGGGDSINDHIEEIQNLMYDGAIVFAMNGASQWARKNEIAVHYQVILDAKEETADLVDHLADEQLFASQCHPKTTAAAERLTLWHLIRENVEDLFPPERVEQGGYALVGGDSSVGVCALCVAFIMGYRDLHIFGYDTSHRNGESHGYKQRMNDTMPTITTEWAGKVYQTSIALQDQCKNFMIYTNALKYEGCKFHVYGDGLLQAIYNSDVSELSEKDKYRLVWMFPQYRAESPGRRIADFYLSTFKPSGNIIDFGCGTGRASIRFKEYGLNPILVDFADNCRDDEALDLPFIVGDLTESIPIHEEHGFCTDVMEHIPEEDVEAVIKNIMASADKVFFQISTIDDSMGELVGATLHHTVKPHNWWKDLFKKLGFKVTFSQNLEIASLFYVESRNP